MVNINREISRLINYGREKKLIEKEDKIFIVNKVLEILKLHNFKEEKDVEYTSLEEILENILMWAVENKIIENSITERELLDTRIMGTFIDRPSNVIKKFNELYNKNPKDATDYYYKLSGDSNYIRRERVKKDLKWKVNTEFGELDITINMSKPEKDPKEIEKALKTPQGDYPKCLLCKECEGYSGRFNYPSRSNHRIIPMDLNGAKWFMQYSPYVYFNEHSIILKGVHEPMEINRSTFDELLEFVDKFKHYFLGSNADLPIVGGSILTHDHYQGGRYTFALDNAKEVKKYNIEGFEGLELSRVKWPLTVLRVSGIDRKKISEFSEYVLEKWKKYSDEELFVYSNTGDVKHNTITPICRFRNGKYEMDLVLRNNIKTEEHPFGVYHPHEELHHIKKENIGLIEVMGLAVLPSRLNKEIEDMKEYLLSNIWVEKLEKHKVWLNDIKERSEISKENVHLIIEEEIGLRFLKVLEHCGVFKLDEKGIEGFDKFMKFLNR